MKTILRTNAIPDSVAFGYWSQNALGETHSVPNSLYGAWSSTKSREGYRSRSWSKNVFYCGKY